MKTQIVTDRAMRSQVVARVVAGAMAGVLTFAGTAGFGGGVAYAQPKKPAPAAAPAAAPAKKGAKPDPKDKDPELKRARDAYASGETKFKAGDFAGALPDFQTADSVKPSSQAARYIGLCQDNLGKFPDAVIAYERFLAAVPPKLQKEGDEIRKRVEEIKAMPARVHVVTVPTGAAISVDGKPANAAAPTDIELSPGAHKLAISADGHLTQEKDVEARYAAHEELSVTLEKAPEPAPAPAPVAEAAPPVETALPPPPVTETRSLAPAFITGGLAVAAAGVGTAFGIMALKSRSDFLDNPTTEKADSGENQALVADMAFGVALTLGVTSVVLFLSGDDSSAAKPAASNAASPRTAAAPVKKPSSVTFTAAPIVLRQGGGAGAVLTF